MGKRLLILSLMVVVANSVALASAAPSSLQEFRDAEKMFVSGRFHEAIPVYRKLLVSLPTGVASSTIKTRIADSYFGLGLFRDALESYRSAIKEQAEPEQAQTQYWIGFSCFLLGRHSEAVAEFLKIPEQHPSSGMWVGTAYYWAGKVSERMGKKGEAAAYYRKAGSGGKSVQGRFALKKAEAVTGEKTK